MADVGLAEKSGGGKIGRAGPHLDRIAPTREADDELIVRDLRLRTAKGCLLVIDGKTGRLHGGFIGPPWFAARVVIDDLDVDATIEKAMGINDVPVVVDFVVGKDAMVWPMVAAGTSNDDIKVARDTAPDFDYDMGEVVSEG